MKRSITLLILIAILISGCSDTTQTSSRVIKFAYLPIVDSLPLFVAQSEGLFKNHGVTVELIPVQSAPERDQLFQSGQIDGVINEILNVMQFNKEGVKVQIVRHALMADETVGHFFVIASANSGITTPVDLKNVEIGISQGTIIEYTTTRLLETEGLNLSDIKYVAIPKLPDRLNLVLSGEAKAVVLPDPLASMAFAQGAINVIDDTKAPALGASVISFSKEIIDEDPIATKNFLNAYNEAIELINANPSKYKGLLAENKVVPPTIYDNFVFPIFPASTVPSQSDWDDVYTWAKSNGLLNAELQYIDSVNTSFQE